MSGWQVGAEVELIPARRHDIARRYARDNDGRWAWGPRPSGGVIDLITEPAVYLEGGAWINADERHFYRVVTSTFSVTYELGAPEPEPQRPEWVRLTESTSCSPRGSVLRVASWRLSDGGPICRCGCGEVHVYHWEPAEAPEPTVTIELPLTWVQWQADGMPYENDLPFDIEDAVTVACRAALEADQ